MTWVSTQFSKRRALVELLRQGSSLSSTRGNFIWCIVNNELIAYEIKKENELWQYKKITEEEMNEEHLSCPFSYFDKVEVKNKEWRQMVLDNREKLRNLNKEIKKIFKQSQKENKELLIGVNTEAFGYIYLRVESVVPLAGRYKGRLYQIPLRRIDQWKIQ